MPLRNMDEDEYRDVLKSLSWSDHAIEQELSRFRLWRDGNAVPRPEEPEKAEPTTQVEKIARRRKNKRSGVEEE